ncbi:MAG: SUMF1/EgtB/PvdO family nonheme iron enzyme [Treponema sp.]|nr:SUMF1/EgtB/PvdO family nonheme iron enzyme [Treponema sp.]
MSEDDVVHLKPILGIKPGHYLGFLYLVIILVILFFLILFPGLYRPGSLVIVESEPGGAAFRVDGVYIDTSPCTVFISRGAHRLEAVLPGFDSWEKEMEIPGRLLFSLLFPRRISVKAELSSPDPFEAFAETAAAYAAWTFGGEPTLSWQIPLSLSEGAYRTGPAFAAAAASSDSSAEGILHAAARFAVTRAGFRDLVRARCLIDNGGISSSPLSLSRSTEKVLDYLSENPEALSLFAALLPEKNAELFEGYTLPLPEESPSGVKEDPPALRLEGISFYPVPGKDFSIAETPAGAESWEAFTAANPRWGEEGRDTLVIEGLASDEYLFREESFSFPWQTAVSWYAAEAFCRWLSIEAGDRLPSGWEIRLPGEAEYEASGGDFEIWEWCADPYAPLSRLSAPAKAIEAVGSPERGLRNGKGGYASLPPESCSPLTGFRPVIARKDTE